MERGSDESIDDSSRSNKLLNIRKKNAYGLFKKQPFLPPGVSKNTPTFKYIPDIYNEEEDKIEKARQMRYRSYIKKRPFLPVGKSITSFNVNFKHQTPLWEKALKKRKFKLKEKLASSMKVTHLKKNNISKSNSPVTFEPKLSLFDDKKFNSNLKKTSSNISVGVNNHHTKYGSLAQSKLIRPAKHEDIKKYAISTPFVKSENLNLDKIGNFSGVNNHNKSIDDCKRAKHNITGNNMDESSRENSCQLQANNNIPIKTPGQLRYSLRERKSTPNYSLLLKSTLSSKKRKKNSIRSKLIKDIDQYQKKYLEEQENGNGEIISDAFTPKHNLFSSPKSKSTKNKNSRPTLLKNLNNVQNISAKKACDTTVSPIIEKTKKIVSDNDESENNSWFYPPSPMDDVIVNKRRSHYRF